MPDSYTYCAQMKKKSRYLSRVDSDVTAQKVWRFHERFGALRVGETEHDYFYRISESAIRNSMQRFRRFLDKSLFVQFL